MSETFNSDDLYECGKCGKSYIPSVPRLRCLVMHDPETCCHFGEMEIK
jgi:hypothetical protein